MLKPKKKQRKKNSRLNRTSFNREKSTVEIQPRVYSSGVVSERTAKAHDLILKSLSESSANFDTRAIEDSQSDRGLSGVIEPPYEKDLLERSVDRSDVLSTTIEAFVDAIEGYGHRLVPVINIDSEDGIEEYAHYLEERDGEPVDVDSEAFKKEIRALRIKMRKQKKRVDLFFKNAPRREDGRQMSWMDLKRFSRKDKERTGEWYWEVIRDDDTGEVVTLNFVPSAHIKKTIIDKERTEVKVKIRGGEYNFVERTEYRVFRRYVQVSHYNERVAFFKEFGDPRVFSSRTGKEYESERELHGAEGKDISPATELIFSEIFHALTPYGQPRYLTNTPGFIGKRKAEEVNADFFDSKAIPPQIVMVSGGTLAGDAEQRIRDHLEGIKGSDNFHKILVLEAMPFNAGLPGQTPHRVQLEVKSLMDKMQNDALFLEYMKYNDERIPERYRIPGLLLGRSDEYTRATAKEAYKNFEETVASIERATFDDMINQVLFPELDASLWMYRTNGRDISDVEEMARLIDASMKNGAMTPEDMRTVMEKMFNIELPPLKESWAKMPIDVWVAATQAGAKIETSLNYEERQIDAEEDPSDAGSGVVESLSGRTSTTHEGTRQSDLELGGVDLDE